MNAKLKETILNPILKGNPITVLVLGICSSLAVTVQMKGAFVMGLSVIVVTALSNFIVSLMRNSIPNRVRIIVQLVVVSLMVILVDQFLKGYAYAIDKLQDRGKFFIEPGEEVYMGEVVGEHVHDNDLVINVCKAKQLTNTRASGSDDKARIVPRTVLSLEEALEYIKEDELVEVTPKSMRMRKIILDHNERKKASK